MLAGKVVLKEVGPIRVAELTATAASYGPREIGLAIRPLYPELSRRLSAAGLRQAPGPAIAYYEDPAEPSDAVTVHAAMPVAAGPGSGCDFAVVDLPAIRLAATLEYLPVGYHREVYPGSYPARAASGMILIELQVALTPALWPPGAGRSPRSAYVVAGRCA